MDDWKKDRVGAALRGENPTVLARLGSGFAVIGDVQFLPGYCVLISADPKADRLADLSRAARLQFLGDMDLVGEAVQTVCSRRDPGFRRINYEIQGNTDAFLHAHIWPRYDWEPDERRPLPVGRYPLDSWRDSTPEHILGPRHNELRLELTAALESVRSSTS